MKFGIWRWCLHLIEWFNLLCSNGVAVLELFLLFILGMMRIFLLGSLYIYIWKISIYYSFIISFFCLDQLVECFQFFASFLDINDKAVYKVYDRNNHNSSHQVYHHIYTPLSLILTQSISCLWSIDWSEETYSQDLAYYHENIVICVIKWPNKRDKYYESSLKCSSCYQAF